VEIKPLTAARLPDLASLFGSSKTTTGCYCMWFLLPAKESQAGWDGANQAAFEACARSTAVPMGLLAYLDGAPVGWCAVGPRVRYARALRSPLLRDNDRTEDERVWLVPCFFVRVGFRRQGITGSLLDAAVALAARSGAAAIEGFPLAGDKRRGNGDAYLGVEPMFANAGFEVVSRPSPNRVVMRRAFPR
jgi:GNAT superfamily N-acetyltransferase